MAGRLILRGGGDAGGIYIDAHGHIRPVPPFEPGLRFRLAALGHLTRAADYGEQAAREETTKLVEQLSAHVLRDAQALAGDLEHSAGLIRLDGDDIELCPPPRRIRIPRPGDDIEEIGREAIEERG